MQMNFPTNGSGRPFVRINGTTGSFALSVPEGGDPEIAEMKGRLLDLDLIGAGQGYLRVTPDGADWVSLTERGAWLATPRPSPDHKPGVRVDLMCADWDAPKVRELRGSSRAVTGFIARVALAAGDIPDGKAVRIRLTGARVGAVAVDPSNTSTLYAGTSGLGVSKSTDMGATWTGINNGLTSTFINALGIDPGNTSTV